jgi:single-strand DNA-binding protein
MNDMNSVSIIGRLTRDGELKYTNSGMAVCKFAIACNAKRKNGDQWIEEAHFFDVVLWGKSGEALNQYLLKGKQIAVKGKLVQSRWEKDGQQHSRVEIHADDIQLLGDSKPRQEAPNKPSNVPLAPPGKESTEYFNDDIPFS